MSQNSHRLTASHFSRHEPLIAEMLRVGAGWSHEQPIRAGTLANNINFAIKWFIETPDAVSDMFDRPALLAFRLNWVVTPHKTHMHKVVLRERISHGRMRPIIPKPSVVVPKTEGMRVQQLLLDVADLSAFRAVLTCMRHHVIVWPIPFRGEPLAIHFDYVSELAQDIVELEYNTDTDTTVLLPLTA